jgi:hypothetical protein
MQQLESDAGLTLADMLNKTSQATPVFGFLFALSQVPGAPEFFR